MYGLALAIIEHRQNRPAEVNLEVLGLARDLSPENWAGLVLAGPEASGLTAELRPYCPRLYTVIDPSLEPYNPQTWLPALVKPCQELKPSFVLCGQTAFGLDLAPALAQALEAPLASDVLAAEADGDGLIATRPVYGGKLLAKLKLEPANLSLLSLRPGLRPRLEPGPPGQVTALSPPQGPAQLTRRFLDFIPAAGGIDLTRAKVIVSVGRGIEGPENIELAQELAQALGAELACSRPVADLGWLDKERQVGLSGQTVKPKVYLALGISGAYQHQVGMGQAETIIAVNRDPEAPIFDIAHFGVAADLFEVVPALIEAWQA